MVVPQLHAAAHGGRPAGEGPVDLFVFPDDGVHSCPSQIGFGDHMVGNGVDRIAPGGDDGVETDVVGLGDGIAQLFKLFFQIGVGIPFLITGFGVALQVPFGGQNGVFVLLYRLQDSVDVGIHYECLLFGWLG